MTSLDSSTSLLPASDTFSASGENGIISNQPATVDFRNSSNTYEVNSTRLLLAEHFDFDREEAAAITITERTNPILKLFSKYKVKVNKNVWEKLNSDGTVRTVKVKTDSKEEFTYNLEIKKDCNCLSRKKLVVYFTADTKRPYAKVSRQKWEAVGSKLKKDLDKQLKNKNGLFDRVWESTSDIRNHNLKTRTQQAYLSNNKTRPSRAASVGSGFLSGLKNFVLAPTVVLLVTPLAPLHPILYMINNTDSNPHDHKEIGFKEE